MAQNLSAMTWMAANTFPSPSAQRPLHKILPVSVPACWNSSQDEALQEFSQSKTESSDLEIHF